MQSNSGGPKRHPTAPFTAPPMSSPPPSTFPVSLSSFKENWGELNESSSDGSKNKTEEHHDGNSKKSRVIASDCAHHIHIPQNELNNVQQTETKGVEQESQKEDIYLCDVFQCVFCYYYNHQQQQQGNSNAIHPGMQNNGIEMIAKHYGLLNTKLTNPPSKREFIPIYYKNNPHDDGIDDDGSGSSDSDSGGNVGENHQSGDADGDGDVDDDDQDSKAKYFISDFLIFQVQHEKKSYISLNNTIPEFIISKRSDVTITVSLRQITQMKLNMEDLSSLADVHNYLAKYLICRPDLLVHGQKFQKRRNDREEQKTGHREKSENEQQDQPKSNPTRFSKPEQKNIGNLLLIPHILHKSDVDAKNFDNLPKKVDDTLKATKLLHLNILKTVFTTHSIPKEQQLHGSWKNLKTSVISLSNLLISPSQSISGKYSMKEICKIIREECENDGEIEEKLKKDEKLREVLEDAEKISAAIKRETIVTNVNNIPFVVERVDFTQHPMSKNNYLKQSRFEYYKERYNIEVQDTEQPLIAASYVDQYDNSKSRYWMRKGIPPVLHSIQAAQSRNIKRTQLAGTAAGTHGHTTKNMEDIQEHENISQKDDNKTSITNLSPSKSLKCESNVTSTNPEQQKSDNQSKSPLKTLSANEILSTHNTDTNQNGSQDPEPDLTSSPSRPLDSSISSHDKEDGTEDSANQLPERNHSKGKGKKKKQVQHSARSYSIFLVPELCSYARFDCSIYSCISHFPKILSHLHDALDHYFLLEEFEQSIDIHFQDKYLLRKAFTHASYAVEKEFEQSNNQRIEFLGDAVLQISMALYIYEQFTTKYKYEGDWHEVLIEIIRNKHLHQIAIKMNLIQYLLFSQSKKIITEAQNTRVLADTFESIAGAILLEFGIDKAIAFCQKHCAPESLEDIPLLKGKLNPIGDFKFPTPAITPQMQSKLDDLEQKLGMKFENKIFLLEALNSHEKPFVHTPSKPVKSSRLQKARRNYSYNDDDDDDDDDAYLTYGDFYAFNNERMKFIGNAVLKFIVTEYIFLTYPSANELQMTLTCHAIYDRRNVCSSTTVKRLKLANLFSHSLNVTSGSNASRSTANISEQEGNTNNSSATSALTASTKSNSRIAADVLLAVIGAIFMEGDMKFFTHKIITDATISSYFGRKDRQIVLHDIRASFIHNIFLQPLEDTPELSPFSIKVPAKNTVQHLSQVLWKTVPKYVVTKKCENGKQPEVAVDIVIQEKIIGRGTGSSKRKAQDKAIQEALEYCKKQQELQQGPNKKQESQAQSK